MKKASFWKTFFIVCLIVLFFTGVMAAYLHHLSKSLPPVSQLVEYELKMGTKIYDNNGNLVKIFASENRRDVRLSEISDTLKNAFIAIEDANFWNHNGIDFYAILRAVKANLLSRDIAQGASTITQQLARDMFLSRKQTMKRKFKEMLLAFKIERTFSKEQILEMYLNKTYLGGGNYGVESAAQNFFGKSADEITPAESALIARLPQAPTYLNPKTNLETVLKRSKDVLYRMYQLGFINLDTYFEASRDTIKIKQRKQKKEPAGYYFEYIRKHIEENYGTSALYNGDLRVYTPVDYDLTVYADSVLNDKLINFEKKMEYDVKYNDFPADTVDFDTKYVQGGCYAIDPNNGYVRLMIGGRNFNHSKFNRMLQKPGRQPGSAIKPIVYTAALENSFTPATMINDLPLVFIQNDTVFWKPQNYSGKNYGLTPVRTALQHSRNIPTIRIINEISPQEVVKYARRFGIESYLPPVLSLGLGSAIVRPAELITSYSVLANGGEQVEPIYIRRIEDASGEILEQHFPSRTRKINKQLAFITTDLMRDVVDRGTAAGIRWRGFRLPAAGKTGTTDDFGDAWCIAFTRRLVLGIWVGFDDNISLGEGQAGAYVAVPPWPYIMKRAVHNSSPIDSTGKPIIDEELYEFKKPKGVVTREISNSTGLLAKEFETDTREEYFISGTEPTIISDSLGYNFGPLGYQDLDKDTLYIHLEEQDWYNK